MGYWKNFPEGKWVIEKCPNRQMGHWTSGLLDKYFSGQMGYWTIVLAEK